MIHVTLHRFIPLYTSRGLLAHFVNGETKRRSKQLMANNRTIIIAVSPRLLARRYGPKYQPTTWIKISSPAKLPLTRAGPGYKPNVLFTFCGGCAVRPGGWHWQGKRSVLLVLFVYSHAIQRPQYVGDLSSFQQTEVKLPYFATLLYAGRAAVALLGNEWDVWVNIKDVSAVSNAYIVVGMWNFTGVRRRLYARFHWLCFPHLIYIFG